MSALIETLSRRAANALSFWGLPQQTPELLKYRENAVFKIQLADGGKAALRLHRPGYHDEVALMSELQWMQDLQRQGIDVPRPISALGGSLLVTLEGENGETCHADLIGWVEGAQIGQSGQPLNHGPDALVRIFSGLGATMARMHAAADRWALPPGFSRHAWDTDGLLGEAPVWGRFWDCPGLSSEETRFLNDLRRDLMHRLVSVSAELDYGLIHADLVRENVLVSDPSVALIDFDDCGHGWRLFDIATALLRNRTEPHYALIRSSLIDGYRSVRDLPETALLHLPLFMVLRGVTYIGWAGARPDLPDADNRLKRYITEARHLAQELEKADQSASLRVASSSSISSS